MLTEKGALAPPQGGGASGEHLNAATASVVPTSLLCFTVTILLSFRDMSMDGRTDLSK